MLTTVTTARVFEAANLPRMESADAGNSGTADLRPSATLSTSLIATFGS
jgi:hypothetical protein